MQIKNLILVPIIIAILATTAWSVYHVADQKATPKQSAARPANLPADNFFEALYRERLKEEGIRTQKVEKLLKEGKLSDKPARYVNTVKEKSD